ncbi:hypothetical protein LINPERHAP2_LOCUS16033 [Linum perenne]
MYRLRSSFPATTKPLRRFFTQLAVAVAGFRKPNLAETILAIPRVAFRKNISAKERKVGRVPDITFEQENGQQGGSKRLVSIQSKRIRNLMDKVEGNCSP